MTKFLTLKLTNFLSYKTLDINLDDIAYASVVGENGSGKSTIPQGIAWLLYGASRFGNNKDSVVNDSAKTASGILTLLDKDGQKWKIERSWTTGKGGGGGLALFYEDTTEDDPWQQFGGKLKESAQTQINLIIGLTRDAFYSLVIMDQSKYPGGTAFTASESNKRREILTGLVPELAIWKDLEMATRANLREANKDYDADQAKIDQNIEQVRKSQERESSIKIILEELDADSITAEQKAAEKKVSELNRAIGAASAGEVGAIQSKIDSAEAQHRLALNELNSKADKIDNQLADSSDFSKRISALKSKKSAFEETIADIIAGEDDLVSSINETKSIISEEIEVVDRIAPKIESVNRRITEARSKKRDIDEQLDALGDAHGDGVCWVCGTELSEEKHANIVTKAVKERDEANETIEELSEELDILKRKLSDANKEIQSQNAALVRQNNEAAQNERDKKNAAVDIESTEDEIDELTAKILSEAEEKKLDAELKAIDKDIAKRENEFEKVTLKVLREQLNSVKNDNNTDELRRQLDAVEDVLEEIRFRKTKLERNLSSLEEAERNTAELNKQNKRMNREALEKKQHIDRLSKLVHATSPKGIPSILLDSILAAIEDEQNRILSSLSGSNQMTVEFTQERENKGEGSKEVLDIIVHTSDGTSRLYESFSFGERVRLSISNLFAMIKVFNERSGGVVSTLFLDEPLGPLDKNKIPAFIDILRVAMNEGLVDSIFVITHDDRVIEALPQQVLVTIDPETKTSSLEVS
jgi:DNA repair exonuclease SbcCD ATPase subunit